MASAPSIQLYLNGWCLAVSSLERDIAVEVKLDRKPSLILQSPQANDNAFGRWKCLDMEKGLKGMANLMHRAMFVACGCTA